MTFLDKLESLLIDSLHVGCLYMKGDSEEEEEKDTIYISGGSLGYKNEKTIYIKEFIHFLKNPDIESQYSFTVNLGCKSSLHISLMEELISLYPSDDDLLLLYKQRILLDTDIPVFFQLLKNKKSFLEALKMGNISFILLSSDHEVLQNCFNQIKQFHLSQDDYYDIFLHYIKNSRFISQKDKLFQLFTHYLDNHDLLEFLFEKLYKEKITIYQGIQSKTVQKIEINSLSLMKNYKFISANDLDNLLSLFINCSLNNIDNLPYLNGIEYFKSVKESSSVVVYYLIIDTSDINECMSLLDMYLKYFVEFNASAVEFVSYIKSHPQIFQNFILYKKLGNKLNIKNTQSEIKKI